MAAKKTTPKKQSKAAYVRSLPATTPAKEVVAKAKEEGITLTESYVYNVRATSKTGPRKRGPAAKKTSGSTKHTGAGGRRGASAGSGTEDLLRAVAAELGLKRAIDILEGERARVRNVLGS